MLKYNREKLKKSFMFEEAFILLDFKRGKNCQATGTGTWDLGLGPGTWDLGPGTWNLGPGT